MIGHRPPFLDLLLEGIQAVTLHARQESTRPPALFFIHFVPQRRADLTRDLAVLALSWSDMALGGRRMSADAIAGEIFEHLARDYGRVEDHDLDLKRELHDIAVALENGQLRSWKGA